MQYSLTDWLLFFFLYCVLGWIWESSYVSVKSRTWVNRGFLYGPWLPIYGSGALIILMATLAVRGSIALIFLLGMISATALEYATGALMERLFHMRYWDYSDKPLNLNGHICVTVSLAWGCFSLLLVRVIHPPLERLVLAIPAAAAEAVSFVLVILFTVDCVKSVQAALDLRELLAQITEHNRLLQTAEARMAQLSRQLSEGSARFRERLQELEQRRAEAADSRARRAGLLEALEHKAALATEEIALQLRAAESEQERERLARIYDAAAALQRGVQRMRAEAALRRERYYRRASSLLKRNPGAVSRRYQAALAELKQNRFHGRKKDEKNGSKTDKN